jgi:hypothetical protein
MNDNPLLFDFLYADHERVASFLAQLYGIGSPTEAAQSAAKGKKTDQKADLKLGIIGVGAGGEREWGQGLPCLGQAPNQ